VVFGDVLSEKLHALIACWRVFCIVVLIFNQIEVGFNTKKNNAEDTIMSRTKIFGLLAIIAQFGNIGFNAWRIRAMSTDIEVVLVFRCIASIAVIAARFTLIFRHNELLHLANKILNVSAELGKKFSEILCSLNFFFLS